MLQRADITAIPAKEDAAKRVALAPEQAIAERGWELIEESNKRFLLIGRHKLRYYPLPSDNHDLSARLIILRNTRAELELLFPPEYSPGRLSLEEVKEHKRQAYNSLQDNVSIFMQSKHPGQTLKQTSLIRALEKVLVHLCFQEAILQGEQFLDGYKKGKITENPEDVLDGIRDTLAKGVNWTADTRLPIAGSVISKDDDLFYSKFQQNIEDILDLKKPIANTILDWYKKTVDNMDVIDKLVSELEKERLNAQDPTLIPELRNAAYDLVQARRNEAEYTLALARFHGVADGICEFAHSMGFSITDPNLLRPMPAEAPFEKDFKPGTRNPKNIMDDIFLVARTREILPSMQQQTKGGV